jgi:L-seryl-tRNA(Ser) seleniumtransferase
MSAGDEKVVADRLYAVLSKPPKIELPPEPEGQPVEVSGQWEVQIEFQYGAVHHTVLLEQEGARLVGTHRGEFAAGDLSGSVAANTVRFHSSLPTDGVHVGFQFSGTVQGNHMSGKVGLGEYGEARWTAERHQYRNGQRG